MTRFEKELSGELGAFWKKNAEKELETVREELASGEITIDEAGVARNCIGRVLMDDRLEQLLMITDKADAEATRAARAAEVKNVLEAYRAEAKAPTEAEKAEMRAAFGEGETVVNIITGETITL